MGVVPDAEIARRDASLRRDRGRLDEKKKRGAPRAAAEMDEMPVVGEAVRWRNVLAHRRHGDAVAKRDAADGERAELRRAGTARSSLTPHCGAIARSCSWGGHIATKQPRRRPSTSATVDIGGEAVAASAPYRYVESSVSDGQRRQQMDTIPIPPGMERLRLHTAPRADGCERQGRAHRLGLAPKQDADSSGERQA